MIYYLIASIPIAVAALAPDQTCVLAVGILSTPFRSPPWARSLQGPFYDEFGCSPSPSTRSLARSSTCCSSSPLMYVFGHWKPTRK